MVLLLDLCIICLCIKCMAILMTHVMSVYAHPMMHVSEYLPPIIYVRYCLCMQGGCVIVSYWKFKDIVIIQEEALQQCFDAPKNKISSKPRSFIRQEATCGGTHLLRHCNKFLVPKIYFYCMHHMGRGHSEHCMRHMGSPQSEHCVSHMKSGQSGHCVHARSWGAYHP